MRKFEQVFKNIADLRSTVRGEGGILAKAIIGASIHNNRTLSVNQTIQYLNAIGKKKLAKEIATVYPVLRPYIVQDRVTNTRRTDAIDLAELVDTYRAVVMEDRKLRRVISSKLNKAA